MSVADDDEDNKHLIIIFRSLAVAFTAIAGLGPASLFAMLTKRFIKSNCEVVFYIVSGVSLGKYYSHNT